MGGYIGVNGRAHRVKHAYVGIEGIARAISEGYVGINDKAYRFVVDPSANLYGDSSDGDLRVTAGQTVSLPVELDHGQIIKNYRSLTIDAGGILKPANRCNGMILLVRENLTINGTIDMNKMAPLANDNEEAHAQEPHILMLGSLTGGASGNAGAGFSTDGASGDLGVGSSGFVFGGAPGAGSGGVMTRSEIIAYPERYNGGDAVRPPRGTQIPYTPTTEILYGAGGGIITYIGASLQYRGGAGPGGSGFAQAIEEYDGMIGYGADVDGIAGDAIGGGALYIFVGGNVTIGSTGIIRANGGNGASGVYSIKDADHYLSDRLAISGGGSGAGGGVVALIYRGTCTNNGTVTASGGAGGAGVTVSTHSSQAGADGDDGTVLVSSIFDIINNSQEA